MARANAARLGLPLEVELGLADCRRASTTWCWPTCPTCAEGEWAALQPEIRALRAARGAGRPGADGLDAIRELVAQAPPGTRLALEHAPGPGRGGARAAGRRRDLAATWRGCERVTVGTRALTPEEVATFERCIAVGGVALFPADTVYGLATEPDSREGVQRLYRAQGAHARTGQRP